MSVNRSAIPGYHGAYLRVDLTTGSARRISLPEDVLRRFIGGAGLGVWLLWQEGGATADPLSPAAPLAFVFSPLVGGPLTTSAKFAVVCKSPLTMRLNDSLASSGFAIAGKKTGYDAIVLTGRCQKRSTLLIDDGNVSLQDASHLSGMSARDAGERLKQQCGDNWRFAAIGPSGERLVHYATISHDGRHAGRGGAGAVMGAKNLKAAGVRGTKRVTWADQAGLTQLAREISQKSLGPATEKYRELGTAANLMTFNRLKALPTHNFQQGSFENAAKLEPSTLAKSHNKTRASCAACNIGCEHLYSVGSAGDAQADNQGQAGVRVEYENLFALGPLCGVSDADTVLKASQMCDEAGIDTISAGGTIAFAMECVARGLLDQPWLQFGDGDALLRALRMIGANEGFGSRLALGSRELARQIGGEAPSFAPHVKGLEIPGYEPRALQTLALGFAVETRGADHNRSGAYEADFSPEVNRRSLSADSAANAIRTADKAALMDSLILCKFLRGVFDDFHAAAAGMLRLTTGWDMTAEELQRMAERIVTAKKQFNIAAGWQPQEDTLPARFLSQPLADDPAASINAADLGECIARYNLLRGWSSEGWIENGLLDTLNLQEFRLD